MSRSKYIILIICEGENTEPSFFNSIKDEIQKGTYDIQASVQIRPEPKVSEDSAQDESTTRSPHKKQRRKRTLRKAIIKEPEVIHGAPPLKWIRSGQKELEDGTYDEVWTVFDHDDHPTRQEAFEEAEKEILGKKIKIAFSSRSFEYYTLLHFERIYRTFQKTDCKEDGNPINCGTGEHDKDCQGKECINGYARDRGYWDDSKKKESIFPILKDRLVAGFENSAWLRFLSDLFEHDEPIYNRNPYISTDSLVKRLTGREDYQWVWTSNSGIICGICVSITSDFQFKIQNTTKISVIIRPNSFFIVQTSGLDRIQFGERKVLYPSESYIINITNDKSQKVEYLGFKYENSTLFFDYSIKQKALAEMLLTLSHKDLTDLHQKIKLDLNK